MPDSRNTKQKQAIIKALESSPRPLRAEEIYELAKTHCPRIGQRTVFRNLAEMIKEFLLVRVQFPGQPVRYELPHADGGHHPHFICRNCNQVFILPGETPSVMDKIEKSPDYIYEGEEVIIFGRCVKCQ